MRLALVTLVGLALAAVVAAGEPAAHWAFVAPKRPSVPGAGHPVDAFLAVERAKHGPTAAPEADRRALIRRVYLDLVGVPPTPEEVRDFLADMSGAAYEKVVDRLLASPMYGERWGRHWMDVWRYSDWDGFGAEVRNSQPHIWHWRDWIVESLNADKGYDRMVVEMLAGDELAPDDSATVRATGFLARNWFMFNRNVWLESTVEHTAKAFLALTINCARCHEHKYDPIEQDEYFKFRAIFEPHEVRLDRLPGQPDTKKDGIPRVYDAKLEAPTYLFQRGNELKPDTSKSLPPGLPAMFATKLAFEPVKLSGTAQCPDKREFVVQETINAHEEAVRSKRQALAALAPRVLGAMFSTTQPLATCARFAESAEALALVRLEVELAEAKQHALFAVLNVERIENKGESRSKSWEVLAKRAVSAQRAAAVIEARRNLATARRSPSKPPGIKAATDALAKAEAALKAPATTAYTPRISANYPATSSGRRLALAKWIVSPENPLAARVAVNHIWIRHFGRPLVATVFDFGKNGQPPTHPELLDWLATEFVRTGWSMKQMHRLLVTSAAYRQASETRNAELGTRNGKDSSSVPSSEFRVPRSVNEDRYYGRWVPRRLEAEAVRDSVLSVAKTLDPKMGGADIPQELGLTVPRRSIYFRHSVEKYVEMLKVFDAANVSECYRRDESVVPQQALALANNPLVLAQARLLARKLAATHRDDGAFVAAAFERVLGRPPRAEESAECVKFLAQQAGRLADKKELSAFDTGTPCPVAPAAEPHLRAREGLVHVLFNHHEFVTLR